jgi:hypothetical protein
MISPPKVCSDKHIIGTVKYLVKYHDKIFVYYYHI